MYIFSNAKSHPAVRTIVKVSPSQTHQICINIVNRDGRWMARERFEVNGFAMAEFKDGTPTPAIDVTDIINDPAAIAARLGNPTGFDPARALFAKKEA